jgi:ABC-type Na+ transport system ATPase subunit NatA
MTEPAVTVRGLTKVFPIPFRRTRLVAVRDLNLEVAPGQVYGLLGPNRSGKSTTLKIILGLVSPSSGSTAIFGRDSREVGSREAVGFLPENPYFYKYLTGAETLRFYGKLCGLRGTRLKNRSDELLELVGLQDARDRRLGGYAKGMLQRIGLAQALLGEPKLVVLDEPTAGVDPAGSREIRDLILDLKRRGITVLPEVKHRPFSLTRIAALIGNTFTELVRLKVFYFLLIFALLLIGSSVFMAQIGFQQEFQVLKDVSLGAMSIFTSLLAIVATAQLILATWRSARFTPSWPSPSRVTNTSPANSPACFFSSPSVSSP